MDTTNTSPIVSHETTFRFRYDESPDDLARALRDAAVCLEDLEPHERATADVSAWSNIEFGVTVRRTTYPTRS